MILLFRTFIFLYLWKITLSSDPELELPHRGCYFPNWADTRPGSGKYEVQDVDPGYCTYICYAFAGIENNILTIKPTDEAKLTQLKSYKTYYPKLKILLSVGGWNLSHQFVPMAASLENRTVFIDSVLTRLRSWNLDGLDLDWEYPLHTAAEQYTSLLKEIRVAFEAEARLLSRTRLMLAAAVSSISRGGYNPLVMARTLDIINLMAYDFHGPTWEPNKTNHNAPLIKSPSDPSLGLNVESLVREWEIAGIPKSSISVGLALYGRAWTVAHSDSVGVGVAALGPAPGGAFTEEPGYYGFFEICAGIKAGQLKRQFDRYARVPHANGQNIWVSYDDVESIRQKAMWVRQSGYGGVFVWEMSLDDFRGACFQTRYPLLQTIKRVLATPLLESKTPGGHSPVLFVNMTGQQGGAVAPPVERITPSLGPPPKSATCATYYHVKSGDTAWNIARQFDISLQDLRQYNPGKVDLDFITQGEKLCVALPNVQRKAPKMHIVQRGETAWDIANLHSIALTDLQQRNPWKKDWDALFPGEELQI